MSALEVVMLKVGHLAPDFALSTVDGDWLSLTEARRDSQSVLLVFLRHLG